MSRVNVEFTAIADAEGKFARLAQLIGLADADHARGKMEHIWMACTIRGETELPQWLVAEKLGERGPEAMVAAELGSWGSGRGDSETRKIRISGAAERCLWLRRNQEQSSKGGKTRARNASRVAGRFHQPSAGSDPPAQTSPLVMAPDPALVMAPEDPRGRAGARAAVAQEPLALTPCVVEKPARSSDSKKQSDYQRVIAAFDERYTERYGHHPTWGPTQFGQVKQLLAKHPADEIIRRIGNLFDAPPPFLAAAAPDFGTLVQHFDKLVEPARTGPYGSAERSPEPIRKMKTL